MPHSLESVYLHFSCIKCGRRKPYYDMETEKICSICAPLHIKRKKPKYKRSEYLLRKDAQEEKYKVAGIKCTNCGSVRSYDSFKKHKRSGRALVNRPCSVCVERHAITGEGDGPLSQLELPEQLRLCIICNEAKPTVKFENEKLCKKCFKKLTVRCNRCRMDRNHEEMVGPDFRTCVYCVVKRNRRMDYSYVRTVMESYPVVRERVMHFIASNHDTYLPKLQEKKSDES